MTDEPVPWRVFVFRPSYLAASHLAAVPLVRFEHSTKDVCERFTVAVGLPPKSSGSPNDLRPD